MSTFLFMSACDLFTTPIQGNFNLYALPSNIWAIKSIYHMDQYGIQYLLLSLLRITKMIIIQEYAINLRGGEQGLISLWLLSILQKDNLTRGIVSFVNNSSNFLVLINMKLCLESIFNQVIFIQNK
jgi:hypothetical protein